MPKALLGVFLLALATPAAAGIPRYPRPAPQIQVVLSDRVKPIQRKAAAPRGRSTITADAVLSIESLTGPIRSEQEQIIVELIAHTPDSEVEEKSDYLFRLGELYVKQQRFWRDKAIESQVASDTAHDAAAKSKLKSDSTAAAHKATDYLLKAVKTYKALTDNDAFRNYPKLDMALFYYGYALQRGMYLKEARIVYDKLLKNFPSSKYVPEAHLAFADYYVEAGQLADAEARYKMVLKFPRSSVYWYAKYKLGSIQIDLGRSQDALATMLEVIQGTKTDKKQAVVSLAAKQEFVRAYGEGKPENAFAAFQRIDRALAVDLVHQLAALYLEQGKVDNAIVVHRELIGKAPADARVCEWQYNVAHAMLTVPGASNVDKVREIEALVKLYRALSAVQSFPAPQRRECAANAAAMAGELARAYHSESTKTRNPETLAFAIRLYRAFLDGFPDEPLRPELQYLLAEALWATGATERNARVQADQFAAAATAFSEVARADDSRALDATRAAVLAWMNALALDPSATTDTVDLAQRTKPPAPRPLGPREAQLVEAIEAYAILVGDPKHVELGELRYIQANLYRRYHRYSDAAPIYMNLVTSHRDAAIAEGVALRALDTLIVLQRLDEMLRLADRLATDPRYLDDKPELDRALKYVRSRSMRR